MVGVKLQATTLIETLAAMTLIMISFGIGMMIYLNILTSNHLERSAKANLHLQEFLEDTKKGQLFYEDEKVIDGYILVKTVHPFGEYGEAFLIEIEAMDADGNALQAIKEIVYERAEKK